MEYALQASDYLVQLLGLFETGLHAGAQIYECV